MTCFVYLFLNSTAFSQKKQSLVQQVQNPVSNLINVPFQDNTSYELGDHGQAQNILNIQPVYPIQLSKKLKLISRIILPITTQPNLANGNGSTNGIGDINATFFFSPVKSKKVSWGLGPVISVPTGTGYDITYGKWCIGPSGVVHYMKKNWVLGGIMNNIWSFAGQSNRESVNAFMFQPFVNYNLPEQWYFSFSPILTANWKASSGNQWIVPLGLAIGKVFTFKKQPLNVIVGAYGNVVKPDIGPAWSTRIQIAFLFPKK